MECENNKNSVNEGALMRAIGSLLSVAAAARCAPQHTEGSSYRDT